MEVGNSDAGLGGNDIAQVAGNDLVIAAAVGDDARHGRGGVGGTDAGIVVDPEVVAACGNTS